MAVERSDRRWSTLCRTAGTVRSVGAAHYSTHCRTAVACAVWSRLVSKWLAPQSTQGPTANSNMEVKTTPVPYRLGPAVAQTRDPNSSHTTRLEVGSSKPRRAVGLLSGQLQLPTPILVARDVTSPEGVTPPLCFTTSATALSSIEWNFFSIAFKTSANQQTGRLGIKQMQGDSLPFRRMRWLRNCIAICHMIFLSPSLLHYT